MISYLQKHIAVIVAATVIAAVLIVFWQWNVPVSMNGSMQLYEVKEGAGASLIADELQQKNIINNAFFFKAFVRLFGYQHQLKAGFYNLSSSMSVATLAKKMAVGDVVRERVTVIEGWDLIDISQDLENRRVFTKEDIATALKINAAEQFSFLAGRPKGATLEGYLFPDTYYVPHGDTATDFVTQALENFDKKLTPELRAEIAGQKKTIFQIITMASMLEKEVRTLEDKKIVAGIFYKRIQAGMPLQVDATVNYVTRKDSAGVSAKDTQIDSPYNTYKYYGLPKGPISNPGADSILAAIYPEKSAYWYYLSDQKTSETIFSKTLEEHNAAVAKYLK